VASYLKETIPGARITWLVEPPFEPLVANNPAIDRVLVFPKKKWVAGLRNPGAWGETASGVASFRKTLKASGFQVALDLQGLLKSALLAVASGAPRRFGFRGTREGADRLLTDAIDIGDYFGFNQHVISLNLRLARQMCHRLGYAPAEPPDFTPEGRLHFPLPEIPQESLDRAENWLAGHGSAPLAVLIPGTTWDTKIWPPAQWSQLAQKLATEGGYRIAVVGAVAETATNTFIDGELTKLGIKALNLTGLTSLPDLIALFRRARLVVGADTGPMHLAAAVNEPLVVGVYGATPIGRNGPFGLHTHAVSLKVTCQPCYEKKCPLGTIACLKDLPAATVYQEIQALS
jgi:heptosyltransferase-1